MTEPVIKQALRDNPSALNAWDACNASGLIEYLYQRVLKTPVTHTGYDGIAEAYSKAIKELFKEQPDFLKHMPNSVVAELLDRSYGETYVDYEVINKLNAAYDPKNNPNYMLWETNKLYEFGLRLVNDPLVQGAKTDWNNYDTEQRLEVARHIHDVQANVFGFTPRELKAGDLPEGWLSRMNLPDVIMNNVDPDSTAYINGQYDSEQNTLTLDTDSGWFSQAAPLKDDDFGRFLETLLHEGEHAFHDQLSENLTAIRLEEDKWFAKNNITEFPMKDGEFQAYQSHMSLWLMTNLRTGNSDQNLKSGLLIGGKLREFAMVLDTRFKIGNGRERELDDGEQYQTDPSEVHAFTMSEFATHISGANPQSYLNELLVAREEWFKETSAASEESKYYKFSKEDSKSCATLEM